MERPRTGRNSMWIDNDKITAMLDAGNKKTTHFPCVCPIYGKRPHTFIFIDMMTDIAEFGHGAVPAVYTHI